MSYASLIFVRSFVQARLCRRFDCERGQATAEYAVVILIAVALGLAVLMLFTGGTFNSILGSMVEKVLKTVIDKISF